MCFLFLLRLVPSEREGAGRSSSSPGIFATPAHQDGDPRRLSVTWAAATANKQLRVCAARWALDSGVGMAPSKCGRSGRQTTRHAKSTDPSSLFPTQAGSSAVNHTVPFAQDRDASCLCPLHPGPTRPSRLSCKRRSPETASLLALHILCICASSKDVYAAEVRACPHCRPEKKKKKKEKQKQRTPAAVAS